MTSLRVMVPVTVAGPGGHGCVPAGPLPRFVQRTMLMPPVVCR